MRGNQRRSEELFSYVRLEERVPKDHPLRAIRALVNEVLAALSNRFEELYSRTGRPSIAPEYLLRATLLQAFFTVRSERQLMEQIDCNLLFRWFVGLSMDDAVWDASTFSKNRDRLLEADVAREFLTTLLSLSKVKRLLSSDHFSVDGTLLEAWASMKSFRPKDGSGEPPQGGRNGERDFRREKRSNETHASTTDPDAKLYRKGDSQESRLCYIGHVLMENRNGLAVAGDVTQATGRAERETALDLVDRHRLSKRRITVGGDKGSMWKALCMLCANAKSPRTSPLTVICPRPASRARPPSMDAPYVMPVTTSANAAANGSKKCSAGSRRRVAWLK